METQLTIASKRDVRTYSKAPIPSESLQIILEAGRVTGSGYNRQPWRFIVVEDARLIESMAPFVNRPSNLIGCPLVLAVVLEEDDAITQFDSGRCAQNLMLSAWDLGIASLPNYAKHPNELRELLSVPPDRTIATILSLGFPARPVDPASRSCTGWLERADRRPLEELVTRL